jgi:hypothetical protein
MRTFSPLSSLSRALAARMSEGGGPLRGGTDRSCLGGRFHRRPLRWPYVFGVDISWDCPGIHHFAQSFRVLRGYPIGE